MTFIVLQADQKNGEVLQVLVSEDAYEGEPADFFVAGTVTNARKVGEIEIVDDDNILHADIYESAN
jgi:hypothetical protein